LDEVLNIRLLQLSHIRSYFKRKSEVFILCRRYKMLFKEFWNTKYKTQRCILYTSFCSRKWWYCDYAVNDSGVARTWCERNTKLYEFLWNVLLHIKWHEIIHWTRFM